MRSLVRVGGPALAVVAILGCSKGEEPTSAPTPTARVDPFTPEPPVNGERVLLPMESPPTSLGELTFSKHPTAMTLLEEGKMGGRGDPSFRERTRYYFVVARGGASEELTLSTTREGLRAELVLLGASVIVRTEKGPPFELTLHSPIAPIALTKDECEQAVTVEAAKRGLDVGRAVSSWLYQGIYEVNASSAWLGFCGSLTRRVWFTKRH